MRLPFTEAFLSSLVQELPSRERPRERLKSHGARALSSSELIAILLGSGFAGHSAVRIAHEILASAHGSLRRLSAQPVAALKALPGVGNARAVAIHSFSFGRGPATTGEGSVTLGS